jgi:hypothetical protein
MSSATYGLRTCSSATNLFDCCILELLKLARPHNPEAAILCPLLYQTTGLSLAHLRYSSG